MSGRKVTAGCKYGYLQGFITDGDDIICPECAKDKLLANNWPITDQYCDLVTNHRPVLWSSDQSQTNIVILWLITDQYCDLVTNHRRHRPVLWSCDQFGHLVRVGGVITCWSPGVVLILTLARVERELLNIWLSFSSFTSHIHFLQQSPCQNILHQIPAPSRFSLLLHFHVDIVHNSS